MKTYNISSTITVKTTLKKAWEFIQNPNNLNLITPPDMHFKIITDIPEKIYNGLIINYNVKIPFMGATNWISEIKHVEEPYQFVDEQRMGPYKWWYHQHQLRETSQGIEVIDRVFYQLPFGILGRIAHKIFVKRQLNRIFSHRNKMFIELLEK